MEETDPSPSLDDLKQTRTDAERAASLQINFVKKILAEKKPDQRQQIIKCRTTLMKLFDTFENAHHAYVHLLSTRESDQSDTSKLMLENEEDYLMIQTDIYSDTLEEIKDHIGRVSSSQVGFSQVESNEHYRLTLHLSHVDSVHRPTGSFKYEGAGEIFHGKSKEPCRITHDDNLRYGERSEILSDKKFGEKFLSDMTSQSGYASKQKDEQLTIYSLSSDVSHCHNSPIENPSALDISAGSAGMHFGCDMQQGPNMSPPSISSSEGLLDHNTHSVSVGMGVRPGYDLSGMQQGKMLCPSSDSSGVPGPLCPLCNVNHILCHCEKFHEMSAADRLALVQEHRFCFNCLHDGHLSKSCTKTSFLCNVQGCGYKHSMWLHVSDESVDHSTSLAYNDPVPNDQASIACTEPATFGNQGQTVPGNQRDVRASRNQDSTSNHVNFSASQDLPMRNSGDQVSNANQPVDSRKSSVGKLDQDSPTESRSDYVMVITGKSGEIENSRDRYYEETHAPVCRVLVNGKPNDICCSEQFSKPAGMTQGVILDPSLATATGSHDPLQQHGGKVGEPHDNTLTMSGMVLHPVLHGRLIDSEKSNESNNGGESKPFLFPLLAVDATPAHSSVNDFSQDPKVSIPGTKHEEHTLMHDPSESKSYKDTKVSIPGTKHEERTLMCDPYESRSYKDTSKLLNPATENDPVVLDEDENKVSCEKVQVKSSEDLIMKQSVLHTFEDIKVNSDYSDSMNPTGVIKQARRYAEPAPGLFDLLELKHPYDINSIAKLLAKAATRMNMSPENDIPTHVVMPAYQWLTETHMLFESNISHPPTLVMNMLAANSSLYSCSQAGRVLMSVQVDEMMLCMTETIEMSNYEQLFVRLCLTNAFYDNTAQTEIRTAAHYLTPICAAFCEGGGTGYNPETLVPDKHPPDTLYVSSKLGEPPPRSDDPLAPIEVITPRGESAVKMNLLLV